MMGWVVSGLATSQAKLAPTEMMLIDTGHVGATFGCENSNKGIRNCSRDFEFSPGVL